jgi:hypothetical protein
VDPTLQVFRLREFRELPYQYFAARSRDEAISMLLRTYTVVHDD